MSYCRPSHLASLALISAASLTLLGCPEPDPLPPQLTAPASPTNLVATVMSSSQINLSWNDASTDEDGFAIERCTGAGCSNFSAWRNAPENATGYTDISVTGATSYSYRVRASNSIGMSSFSNTATGVTPTAGAVPAPPTNLAATMVNSSSISVTWTDASTNEDGFKVERCEGATCTNFAVVVTTLTPNSASVVNTGLAASTTYRFRVQSYNGSGGSAFAGPVAAATASAAVPPVAPTGLTATAVSSSRINLAWVDNSNNEDAFIVERCQGAGCANFSPIGSTPSNGWSDLGLLASTSYTYRVRATNGVGQSPYSGVASATTQPATPPVAPTGLTATATSSTAIALAWTDNATNEDEFLIESCVGATCTNFVLLASRPANVTNYSHTALNPSTSYRYRVRARNGAGASAFTAIATAATPGAPAAPSNLTATAVSTSRIDLAWTDNASNEDGFAIERCVNAGCSNFAALVNVGPNVTSYANAGLTAGTSYSYRVRAANAAGASNPTAIATAVTQSTLTAPTLNTPTVSGTSITLSWSFSWPGGLACSCDGYQLEESTTSPTSGFVQVLAPATRTTPYTHTLTNRQPGTYYYRVRAVTNQGTSPYSTVRSATVAAQTAQITLINNLSGVGSQVLRFRVAANATELYEADNTAAERLSPDSYCGGLPGAAIDPGETATFNVAANAPNYRVYIGLGRWDNSDGNGGTTCWFKKNWAANANFDLMYIYNEIIVSGHTGNMTWTLTYSGPNQNIVLRSGTTEIPFVVSLNQDPIR